MKVNSNRRSFALLRMTFLMMIAVPRATVILSVAKDLLFALAFAPSANTGTAVPRFP